MLVDGMDNAFQICQTLMAAPNYSRCYCEAWDWQGTSLFRLRPPSEDTEFVPVEPTHPYRSSVVPFPRAPR